MQNPGASERRPGRRPGQSAPDPLALDIPQWNRANYSKSRSLYRTLQDGDLSGHLSSLAVNIKYNTITPETKCALLDESACRDVPAWRPFLVKNGHLKDTLGSEPVSG